MSRNEAKKRYTRCGVDVERAMERLKTVPAFDVRDFDTGPNKPLRGVVPEIETYEKQVLEARA